ncbi:MAG: hypothetical protein ACREX3_14700 [Gammaproteobacteria bacterium]
MTSGIKASLVASPAVIGLMIFLQTHRQLFARRLNPRPPHWNLVLGRSVLLSGLSPLVLIGTAEHVPAIGLLVFSVVTAIAVALWLFSQDEALYDEAFLPMARSQGSNNRRFTKAQAYRLVASAQICLSGSVMVGAQLRM